MANYDKYMMVGERLDIAKAFNSQELLSPCAVVMDGEFFTERGLFEDSGLIEEWTIEVQTSSPKKSVPTGFIARWQVAYNGEGLKTGELSIHDFETGDGEHMMSDFYSYFPEGTGLGLIGDGDKKGLWHINSKGDYVYDGEKFSFEENTESFTITWQDDIPGDKGEIVSGFVVRTTPYVDPR